MIKLGLKGLSCIAAILALVAMILIVFVGFGKYTYNNYVAIVANPVFENATIWVCMFNYGSVAAISMFFCGLAGLILVGLYAVVMFAEICLNFVDMGILETIVGFKAAARKMAIYGAVCLCVAALSSLFLKSDIWHIHTEYRKPYYSGNAIGYYTLVFLD